VGGNPLDPGSGFCVGTPFWSNTPPPGINRYTPAQAAAVVISRMTEAPIGIGMAPAQKVHSDDPAGTARYRRTWVGIPVWLWVDNPTAQTWGPQSITATVGGVTISATASVNQVVWDAGDGQSVTCGQGTVFVESEWANQAAQDSPTCGFRYQHTGTYTVTATSSWTVSWTGGGDSGTQTAIAKATSSPVTVGQLESVNAPLTQSDIDWGMTH